MKLGYIACTELGGILSGRLGASHPLHLLECKEATAAMAGLPELAALCDVIFICAESDHRVRELIFGDGGVVAGLASGKIIVDQTPGEPELARKLASELAAKGVHFLDAPVHSEHAGMIPESSALLCGGPKQAFEAVRPVLESIVPEVVHFGDAGQGQTARILVSTVATCNRMITYECAAMGYKNGLTVQDMGMVLSCCSGSSSGVTRVLPALVARRASSDASLRDIARDLESASVLAKACGAPLLMPDLVNHLIKAAVGELGQEASFDAIVEMVESAAGIDFAIDHGPQ